MNDVKRNIIIPIHGDFKQLAAGHIRGKGCKDCAGTITKTTEQFIIDARKVHGDEYDYSKSKYINAMTYIEIICRKHGSFWQKPNTHLIGKGCFECYGSKMLTQEEFINRCIEKHNGFYIYDKTIYTGCNYTITITCPVHGDFQQKAGAHLYGQGCTLPPISEAKENTLYFVPKDGSDPDNYNEYIFDPVNKQFELVGQSAIDTTNFAKLSTSNIFLATNTFNEIVTFKKGLKVSESGPVITSNDTTLNLPNTSTPLLKAQSLILNGVSTFNNEIRVSTIAGLTQAPIKVTSAANFNKPIKFNDTIRIETGKIDPGGRGVTWTLGSLIETPTTADNNHHRLCATTDASNIGYIIYHDRVINGVWKKDKIIPANLWDFTWHDEASIKVKNPTKAEYAANKNYVDTQISTISQFDSSSDQTISGTWEFSKPLKITEAQLADEAVSKGYVDETIQQNLNTTLEGVIKFVSMTEAEYKALETKSPSTIYHLTDVSMWAIGDQEIVTSNMPV